MNFSTETHPQKYVGRIRSLQKRIGENTSSKARQLDKLAMVVSCAALLFAITQGSNDMLARGYSIGVAIGLLIWAVRGDYLHPCFLFALPWGLILYVSTLSISDYSRPIGGETQQLVSSVIWLAVLVAFVGRVLRARSADTVVDLTIYYSHRNFCFIASVLFALTLVNIALAGFVPIAGHGADYMDFGVPGIYGFYNAFANVFAVTSLMLFIVSKKWIYLWGYMAVLLIFVLFVTRQNLISALIEGMAVWALLRGRISVFKISAIGCSALVFFDLIGTLRSVDIRELAKISNEYDFVPSAVIWLFAYAYFNILNLDNVVSDRSLPLHDGSMFWGLLPSIFRPEANYDAQLEVSNFNVSSYLSSVYADVGFLGALVVTTVFLGCASASYQRAQTSRAPFYVVTAAVLQFCCLFSFFINFFFYLPIIFQIPIASVFRRALLIERIE